MQAEAVRLDPLGHRQERKVDLVDAQHLGHLLAGLLAHGEPDVGMELVELASASERSTGPIVCIAPIVT